MFKEISKNPLIVSIISIILTTIIGVIAYFIKRLIDFQKSENKILKEQNQNQNKIIQNFNAGMSYSEIEKIVENIFQRELIKFKIEGQKKD